MPNGAAALNHNFANPMQEPVDHADVENLPKSFAGTCINRIDDNGIIDLVNVVLVLEYARHDKQRALLKDDPAQHNAESRDADRQQRQ